MGGTSGLSSDIKLVGGVAHACSSVVTSGFTITTTFITSLHVHVATREEKVDSLQVQISHVEQKQ